MEVCILLGFSFEALHFGLSSVQKRELEFAKYYDNAERNYFCFNKIQTFRTKRIIHKHTKISLGAWHQKLGKDFRRAAMFSNRGQTVHHTTFRGGQIVKRVLEATARKL